MRRAAEEAVVASGDATKAIEYLNKAVVLEPDAAINHYQLYKIRQRYQRNFVGALSDISRAVDLSSEYRPVKAKLLIQLGQCDRAEAEYQLFMEEADEISEDVHKDFEMAKQCSAVISAADQAFLAQEYNEAASYYSKALQFVGLVSEDLLWPKTVSLFHLGDYFGVISDTAKLLKQNGKNVEAYRLRGQAYHRLGEHDQAILHYREGLKMDPEHKECKAGHKSLKQTMKLKDKGDAAFNAGNFEEAIEK